MNLTPSERSTLTTHSARASESIARSLRLRLYDHLQHLPVAYHDKAPTGDQVQRCTSDVDTVRMLFASQGVEIARAVLLLGIGIPVMFWMDWRLALVAVAVLPVIIAFSAYFFGRVRGSFKKMDDAEGAMTATLQENLTGIRVVRAFARQQFECDRFGERQSGETPEEEDHHAGDRDHARGVEAQRPPVRQGATPSGGPDRAGDEGCQRAAPERGVVDTDGEHEALHAGVHRGEQHHCEGADEHGNERRCRVRIGHAAR